MKIALIGDSLTEGRPGVSFYNLLKKQFPDIAFVNLGKPGETVKSLHARLLKTKMDTEYDLSFLWIGVNDVYSKLLSVQAQPAAKDQDEFLEYYEKVLKLVLESSKQAAAVSPALVGENINNAPNNELKELNVHIQSITRKYANVSFLDMQSFFFSRLSKVDTTDYISTKVMRVMADVLFYKKPLRIDRLSEERGLHLTLDGIHLNSAGAQMAADMYASEIKGLIGQNQDAIQ